MSIRDVQGVSLSPHNDHFFILHLDSVSIIAHLHAAKYLFIDYNINEWHD